MNSLRSGSIVVGDDESALAGQAVRWAAEQAALEGRSVRLVRAVLPVPRGRSDHAGEVQPGTFTSLRLHSEALLRKAPEQAHLVVLGSRGRGPALSHLRGSVGVGVARHASCPVVVHRPALSRLVRDGVVVAVDATQDAIPVLDFAFRQAGLRGLPLRVVHYVVDPRSALVGAGRVRGDSALVEEDRLAVAEAMAGLGERYPDVRTTVRTARGAPERDAARSASRADLLVVGIHQRGALGRLLAGSVSTAVLEHATCPVAVVPVRSS